jgi:formylmethanofuran dehydrogenase subunit D
MYAVFITAALCVSNFTMSGDLEKTDRGKVKSVSVGKLVMTDSEGKNEHAYVVPAGAKVTLNEQETKLTDLTAGDAVVVTIGMEGEVISIAAKRTKSPPRNVLFE